MRGRAEGETSAHTLCECKALTLLRHAHLGSFFLDPEDINSKSVWVNWTFGEETGFP